MTVKDGQSRTAKQCAQLAGQDKMASHLEALEFKDHVFKLDLDAAFPTW